MKLIRLVAVFAVVVGLRAEVPSAPQLLPQDALLLVTVPDWTAARTSMGSAPLGKLWADPAMRPFREKFNTGFRTRFLETIERDLGLKPEGYLPLLQGQVSFAVLKGAWNPADPKTDPTLVLVVDVRDKSDVLKARLAEVRAKLTEAKRPFRVERIRDVEFTTLVVENGSPTKQAPQPGQDPDDADDADEAETGVSKLELTFGQVDSVLVMGTAIPGLDRVVARLTGGTVSPLSETAEFQGAEAACGFRDSVVYGFIQAAAVVEALQSGSDPEDPAEGGFGVPSGKIVTVAGLDGLRSISASVRQSDNGLLVRFFAALPESKRAGVFKLLRFEPKDASPPAFVPADAAEFRRIRLNGQQLWAGVEGLMQQLSPQLSAVLLMSVNALGKDRDPGFDFRKSFFGNLGDDLITYGKPPRGKTLPEVQNRPSITLISAVNASELLASVRVLASLLPGGGEEIKEREVNGKKILSLRMPGSPGQPGRTFEIAASGGYVAFASDAVVLEEFLRSAEGAGRSLKDSAGLTEAAQQVGGMDTGFFGFQNQRESAAGLWEALRSGGRFDKLIPSMGVKQVEQAGSWLDFSVLPPFEQVSRYLGINVSSGAWDTQGFHFRSYTPVPK